MTDTKKEMPAQKLVHYEMKTRIQQAENEANYAFKGLGKLGNAGGFRYLRYQEREKETGEVTLVTIKIISPEMLQITRSSSMKTRMVFRVGQETESLIHGPHGVTILKTQVQELAVVDTEEETKVSLHYELYDSLGLLGTYQLDLRYWPQEN